MAVRANGATTDDRQTVCWRLQMQKAARPSLLRKIKWSDRKQLPGRCGTQLQTPATSCWQWPGSIAAPSRIPCPSCHLTASARFMQVQQSETDADDELLALAVVKGGAKVVVGSQSGMLDIWSWGRWAGFSDRFPGEPFTPLFSRTCQRAWRS